MAGPPKQSPWLETVREQGQRLIPFDGVRVGLYRDGQINALVFGTLSVLQPCPGEDAYTLIDGEVYVTFDGLGRYMLAPDKITLPNEERRTFEMSLPTSLLPFERPADWYIEEVYCEVKSE